LKRGTPSLLLILGFFACLLAIAGCFLTAWFEYDATWDPPKLTHTPLDRRPSHTQERLPLFGVGPETFSQPLEGTNEMGCYVVGMCHPAAVPHRLYQADVTVTQKGAIHALRGVGALGLALSFASSMGAGIKYRAHLRSSASRGPAQFTLNCTAILLVGVLILLLFGLIRMKPLIGTVFGGDEYPSPCHPSSPPVVECSYFTSLPPDPEIATYELKTGRSTWEFKRVVLTGPAWTTASLLLAAVVGFQAKLWA
jgi:hypothetical protein